MTDIAIIGGGAAGAAVFGELLQRDAGACVHWITGSHMVPGRGVAYATTNESHLLNVRAAGMGLFTDEREDFVQYAGARLGAVRGADFLPRGLFGDFIEAQVHARTAVARQRRQSFALHADDAVRIEAPGAGGYIVRLAGGMPIRADAVVLAMGSLSQRPLKTVTRAALSGGCYELDPWRLAVRACAPRRVLVIGTGLTAVDTLLSASMQWPQAELVAVSRHGQFPFAHPVLPPAPYAFQPDLNQSLLDCAGLPAMLRRVREAISLHAGDWRAIVDGMRPVNAALWQQLDPAQRRQFLRHLRWIWEAARHRSAPAVAEALGQLREDGRLQVHAARVLKVDAADVDGHAPLEVTVRSRGRQLVSTLEADLVIQATGLDTATAYAADPLLASLLGDGLATADPLQLGLLSCPGGQLLDAHGVPQPGLFALGSLLRGSLWECTAMPEIRVAAHQLARRLTAGDPADAPPHGRGAALTRMAEGTRHMHMPTRPFPRGERVP